VNRSRLEAFSDGVFAVAATLLALDLTVAGPGHGLLASQLADRWPAFVAYLISFFTIGIIWVNHHSVMNNVAVVTRSLLFTNLVLLVVTVTIPFVTATLADYLKQGGPNASVAAALYAGVFELMSISFALLFEWILRHDECVRQPLPGPAKNSARLRFYFGQIPYLVAIGVAFVSPLAVVVITGGVAIYYIFERAQPTPPASAPSAEAELGAVSRGEAQLGARPASRVAAIAVAAIAVACASAAGRMPPRSCYRRR
jgi:uncharacterized membrane protein